MGQWESVRTQGWTRTSTVYPLTAGHLQRAPRDRLGRSPGDRRDHQTVGPAVLRPGRQCLRHPGDQRPHQPVPVRPNRPRPGGHHRPGGRQQDGPCHTDLPGGWDQPCRWLATDEENQRLTGSTRPCVLPPRWRSPAGAGIDRLTHGPRSVRSSSAIVPWLFRAPTRVRRSNRWRAPGLPRFRPICAPHPSTGLGTDRSWETVPSQTRCR